MMGRSQRRLGSDKRHLATTPTLRDLPAEAIEQNKDIDRYEYKPICGEGYVRGTCKTAELPKFKYERFGGFTDDVTDTRICSRCQSKALAKAMGGMVGTLKIGDRYNMSGKLPHNISSYTWKSVYPVIDTSVLADADDHRKIVAFICIESGWGKAWSIHGWTSSLHGRHLENLDDASKYPPGMDTSSAFRTTVREGWTALDGTVFERREQVGNASALPSKEGALLLIPDMIARKQLMMYQDILDADKKNLEVHRDHRERHKAENLERDERRRQQAEERSAYMEHVRCALEELMAEDGGPDLSNFQRDGLLTAAKLLGIEITGNPVPTSVTKAMRSAEPVDIAEMTRKTMAEFPVVMDALKASEDAETDEWGQIL